MNDTIDTSTVRELLDAGVVSAMPNIVTSDPKSPSVLVVPEGYRVETVDAYSHAERHEAHPYRATGRVNLANVDSLVAYVKRHETPASTVWVHPENGRVVAVLDDHSDVETGKAGWGHHRADLQLSHTPEWEFWLDRDGQLSGQRQFAEHVEQGAREVRKPDAATMLELARTFTARSETSFREATNLQDGTVQMLFDTSTDAKAGKRGDLVIPDTFELAVSPFVGEEPYLVIARLRYQIVDGKLRIGYKLDRPDRIVRDALEAVAERLAGEFPNVYIGSPRS